MIHHNMKKRLLIIEDQAPMRRNIALMLELEGYEVFTAENGRIGLEQARLHRPDLVMCDVMMPEMDGYSVVQSLRSDPDLAATPFIFLTAKSDRGDVRVGMNFEADDYLTKPVVRDDLLAAVQVRLSRAETHERQLQAASAHTGFNPDFSTHEPLIRAFTITPREAEVLHCRESAGGGSAEFVAALINANDHDGEDTGKFPEALLLPQGVFQIGRGGGPG
mgnify:CR=1 FL=1